MALTQQLPNRLFRRIVGSFANVIVAKDACAIGQEQMGPIFVFVGFPHGESVVYGDGVADVMLLNCLFDIVNIPLEGKFRRMDADDLQTLAGVFLMPLDNVRDGALTVNAGKGPDMNQYHLALEIIERQGWTINPLLNALKFRESRARGLGFGLDWEGGDGSLLGFAGDRGPQGNCA
jgi:hypothetical protein